MYLMVIITITALLYKLIARDGMGRVRQTVTLQAKRVNVVILNDDHTNATTTGNKTRNWARQQHICQVEDSEAEESNEQQDDDNDIVRSRIIRYLMHRHLLNRLRENREDNEGEYVESDDETVINTDEVDPPAYNDIVKEEAASTDDDE